MRHKHDLQKTFSLQMTLILAITVASLCLQGGGDARASAQRAESDPWTPPVNISESSSTTDPVIVADGSNNVHVVWSDEYAGSVYAHFSDGAWSIPTAVKFPFDGYFPVLIGAGDTIHAFWINTQKNNSLLHSHALASGFGTRNAWSAPVVISKYVGGFAAEPQKDGHINLAYIFTGEEADRPAGIYYARLGAGGKSWSKPVPLFTSRYYRPVTQKTGHVGISSALENGAETIYVTWDNRAVKRVYLSKSIDQGVTWSPPFEVDGPTASMSSNEPFNLQVQASPPDNVLLVWQSNLQSGVNCTQYYQSSQDGGQTWSDRGKMMEGLVGCAQEIKFFPLPDGVLSQIIFQDEVYLAAWDGSRWSQPEAQSTLYSFTDPATDEAVRFRCRQSALDASNQLYVVGCDEIGSMDIWATSREVGPMRDWFSQSSTWNEPQLIGKGQAVIQNLKGLMDSMGRFHILWVADDLQQTTAVNGSLYYTVWDNGAIAIPSKILTSPGRDFDRFSADLDNSRNRLLLTWNDRNTGEIFFSWADIAKAGSKFEWAEPVSVPIVTPFGQSPAVLAGKDGRVYIAYAVPINERRGIYLTYSEDGGVTWSESTRVFDASAANWEIVERPRIDQNRDGTLHLVWSQERYTSADLLPGEYYARSTDHGNTWTEAQLFVENLADPAWLSAVGAQDVFRFWLVPNGDQKSLLNEISNNAGESWNPAENLTGIGETPLMLDLSVGPQDALNLVQVVEKNEDEFILKPQVWAGETWRSIESRTLQDGLIQDMTALSCGVTPNGQLVAVYAFTQIDQTKPEEAQQLFLISQKSAASQPGLAPTRTAPETTSEPPTAETPPATTVPAATTTPELSATSLEALIATPTRGVTPVPNPEPPKSTLDPRVGLVFAGVLSILVVAAFFIVSRFKKGS